MAHMSSFIFLGFPFLIPVLNLKNAKIFYLLFQVVQLKGSRGSDYNSAWKDTNSWDTAAPAAEEWPVSDNWDAAATTEEVPSGSVKYRALYEFVARNQDEVSFQPGDIIMVSTFKK